MFTRDCLTRIVLASLLFLFLSASAESACIVGELANFDVHNFTATAVNDFILVLDGGITCDDICYIWPGYHAAYYDSFYCRNNPDTAESRDPCRSMWGRRPCPRPGARVSRATVWSWLRRRPGQIRRP